MEHAFTPLPNAGSSRLEVRNQHSQILVQTPASQVEHRRNQVRCAGGLLAVTGLVLASFHLALLALIPVGIAAAVIAPGRIRQKELFRVISEPEECLITPIANVMLSSIARIDARYETSGWEGRTNVTGSLTDGTESPLMEIPGTEEPLAKAVCEQLARLCRCPVDYTGPFGETMRFEGGQA